MADLLSVSALRRAIDQVNKSAILIGRSAVDENRSVRTDASSQPARSFQMTLPERTKADCAFLSGPPRRGLIHRLPGQPRNVTKIRFKASDPIKKSCYGRGLAFTQSNSFGFRPLVPNLALRYFTLLRQLPLMPPQILSSASLPVGAISSREPDGYSNSDDRAYARSD